MTFPVHPLTRHPAVTAGQMRELDRIAVEELGITLPQMMENAGRATADVALAVFAPKTVTILAGHAGNGGGGLVAARHLANRGCEVTVALARADLSPVVAQARATLQRMGIAIEQDPRDADLIIDALLGYRAEGDPRGRVGELVAWVGSRTALSLDLPTGLDPNHGILRSPRVKPAATVTLAAPKPGLLTGEAGDIYLADISIPPSLFERVQVPEPAPFRDGPVVRLDLSA